MSGLKPISLKALIKELRSFGFEGPFSGGKHLFMSKGSLDITIPNPHRTDISVDLLSRILKQAAIGREEWLNSNKI